MMDKTVRLSAERIDLDGIPLVRLYGEIDLYTAPEFEKALEMEIRHGARVLVVDLTQISYLDSAGLRSLLAAHRELSERHGELYVIANPSSPGVRRVLEVTRFDAIFRVCGTVEEALAEARRSDAA